MVATEILLYSRHSSNYPMAMLTSLAMGLRLPKKAPSLLTRVFDKAPFLFKGIHPFVTSWNNFSIRNLETYMQSTLCEMPGS